jgi:heme/copper-type cytochrome/quinol oxidase subunit 2
MDNELLTVLVLAGIIFIVIFVFIWISVKLRRGGGSMTTIALGSTDEFLNTDKSKAAETIVNENAGKFVKVKKKTEEN